MDKNNQKYQDSTTAERSQVKNVHGVNAKKASSAAINFKMCLSFVNLINSKNIIFV